MSTQPEDPAGIERDIDATQRHLAATVDELADRVAPKNVAKRTVADLQARGREAVLDERGGVRTERVAVIGGSVLAVLGLFTTASVRRRRKRKRA